MTRIVTAAVIPFPSPTPGYRRRAPLDAEPRLPPGRTCQECVRWLDCARRHGCCHDSITCMWLPSWFDAAGPGQPT